jgi:zinc transporter ZupT
MDFTPRSPRATAIAKVPPPPIAFHGTGYSARIAMAIMIVISAFCLAYLNGNPLCCCLKKTSPTTQHVASYGFLSTVATGLGAVPFMFVGKPNRWWLGFSNALAAGMMMAASLGLLFEGLMLDYETSTSFMWTVVMHPLTRLACGILLGVVFMRVSKNLLDEADDMKMVGLTGLQAMDARRAILVVAVMTMHSFSEGIGIGVSFGGNGGHRLGPLISTTLCIHNIPEGVAVALVLVPKGVDLVSASLWCMLTSFPQVIMAVPAFMFVEYAVAVLPIGLGFAAGAMLWMATTDLVEEAREDLANDRVAFLTMTLAGLCMCAFQWGIGHVSEVH